MFDSAQPNWIVDRSSSDSLKWTKYRNTDILPMWVADMDFRCANPILEALHKRINHGVFGYTYPPEQVKEAIVQWIQQHHDWKIEPDWIIFVPGLVSALNVVCRAFAEDNEKVLTFTPIYPPFMSAPKLSNRGLLTCSLKQENERYTFDPDQLEATLTEDTKVLLLCSPHNPVGRVWERDELQKITSICLERNILLCSDEIHCDLVLDTRSKHIPTATLSPDIANHSVTLMSPAKTFNVPGLNCGFAIIPNKSLRQQFMQTSSGIVPWVNALGYTACQAAFSKGQIWLDEVLEYLRQNHQILLKSINNIDGLSMHPIQATYLAWIDVRQLNLSTPAAFFKQAGVAMLDGAEFNQPGFIRMNFACSQENLLEAIKRIENAVKQLQKKS